MRRRRSKGTEGELTYSQAMLGMFFVAAGVGHFLNPKFYEAIVPESLPNKREIVQVSGIAEIAGGLGVLSSRTRRLSGTGLIALLLAIYPANVNMALNTDRFKRFPPWALWARLPLQFFAIEWVRRATLRRRARRALDEEPAQA